MKLGYSTWAMPKIPIDTSIKFLSETGYDGITIATLPQFTTSINNLDIEERKRILNLSKLYCEYASSPFSKLSLYNTSLFIV